MMIGAFIGISVVFATLLLVFNTYNFVSTKTLEEDVFNATVSYMEVLNKNLGVRISENAFKETDFRGTSCGQGCEEMTCQQINELLNSRGKPLNLDCRDPLGRTWSLRKITRGKEVVYYIYFSPVPRETLMRFGYRVDDNDEQIQKSIALRLSSKLQKGGYIKGSQVFLPGSSTGIDIFDLLHSGPDTSFSSPISWIGTVNAKEFKCPLNRVPLCPSSVKIEWDGREVNIPVFSYFNLDVGLCESGTNLAAFMNNSYQEKIIGGTYNDIPYNNPDALKGIRCVDSYIGIDYLGNPSFMLVFSCFFEPYCPNGRYDIDTRCCI